MNAYLVWHPILNLRESQIVDLQNLSFKDNKVQAKLCQAVLQPGQGAGKQLPYAWLADSRFVLNIGFIWINAVCINNQSYIAEL